MTRRDWWFGVLLLSLAVGLHALVPRYEWRGGSVPQVRVDRWTGRAEIGRYYQGRWISPAVEEEWRRYDAQQKQLLRVPLSDLPLVK